MLSESGKRRIAILGNCFVRSNFKFARKHNKETQILAVLYLPPRYLRLLGRLRALSTLRLDYPALSDDVLKALASAAPMVLRTLHISVRDSDSRQHTVTNATWHDLAVACPKLTVSYTIGINILIVSCLYQSMIKYPKDFVNR